MAKVVSHPEVMMDVEIKKELLGQRTHKEIMIQSDLKGKLIIFSEDIIFKDGSCDFIYYYLDKKASLKDPDTIVLITTARGKPGKDPLKNSKEKGEESFENSSPMVACVNLTCRVKYNACCLKSQ